jgi:LuxR family maltose regulon positive regulatory protein
MIDPAAIPAISGAAPRSGEVVVRVTRTSPAVPRLPPEFVPRPALLAALDRGEASSLTLVCAPPGYGKTLLLTDWIGRSDVPYAWVALDDEDDDPRRLWSSVLAALTSCPQVPESSALRSLVVPRTRVGPEFLVDLGEALDALPERVRLVIDDAHHLRSAETLHGLKVLLRPRRSPVRLVLASRIDPALPLARLRMEGRLCELRTAQLRFSTEETEVLADLCGLQLTSTQAAVLQARADGWVAGIRLAALPLRSHPDPDRFLAAFSGDERPVADYLVSEVFSHVSAEESELLRRVSVSDPLPTPLAVELSGRADAADLLSNLERSTGLVVGSGPHRTEFRIQELMRSYLTADLYRHGPAAAGDLHRQAARWWAVRDRPVEALRHAAQAGDRTLLRALLHRWAAELLSRGEHIELRRALVAAADDPAVDAWLPLISAQINLATGDRPTAEAEVRRSWNMDAAPDDRNLASFRRATSQLAGMTGPTTPDQPAPDDLTLAALGSVGRAAAVVGSSQANLPMDTAAVLDELEAALGLARDRHLGLLEVQCLCLIGAIAATDGLNARATRAASAALSAAGVHGWQESTWATRAQAVLAHSSLAQAEPARALDAVREGLRGAPAEQDAVLRFALQCAGGGALFDLGDRPSGLLELQHAHAELGATPVPLRLTVAAGLLEHRAALLLGSSTAAGTSMGRLTTREGTDGEVTLMRAWTEAAAGSARGARAGVARLLDGSVPPTLPSTLVEAWLVEVWAALRLNDRPGARSALQTALALAAPLDLLRPFALAGAGVRILLVDQLGGVRDPSDFAFRCLAARRQVDQPSALQLSSREQDVLGHLVSLSNLGEIAEDLAVSVNTVKSHVRAIYGKLGVNTRRTAVLTALERGLLT